MKRFFKCAGWCAVVLLCLASGFSANAQDSINSIVLAPGTNPDTAKLWTQQQNETKVYGRTWIGPYIDDPKTTSGKRDTILFVPSQYDKNKPTDVIVWLHGHHGFNKFGTRVLPHIAELYRRGENPIVVAIEQPWTHNGSTPTSRNGTGPFRHAGEFEDWAAEALPMLGFLGVPFQSLSGQRVTIYGHSAGGSGLLSMSRSGALGIVEPKRIVFSDSTYGSWFRGFYDNFYKDYPGTEVVVLARRGGPTHESMTKFFRDRPEARDLKTLKYFVLDRKKWTHKRIGDNCLLWPGAPFPP